MNQREDQPERRPGWPAKLALVGVSLAMTLGVIEWGLREFMPVRGMIYELNDRYLYRLIPGSRKIANAVGQPWPKVLVRINAAGRRGDESLLPHAVHRVVVYGDSYVAAEATPDAQTFTSQLSNLLNRQTDSTVVLNAGVMGYGVDQESLRIEDEVPGLKPDLVIVAAYAGNDFGDLLRDKLFRLDNDHLTTVVPTIDESLKRDFRAPFELSSIQLVRAVQSAVQGRTKHDATQLEPDQAFPDRTAARLAKRVAEYDEFVVKGDTVVRNLLADQYDADVSLTPDSPSARYRVRLMTLVLARIRDLVAKNGANLLLLIIPEHCDVAGDCDILRERQRYPGYRPTALTDFLDGAAREDGITHLNFFDAFHAAGANSLYFPIDEHWNTAGQGLAARLTADFILSSGLLTRPRGTTALAR